MLDGYPKQVFHGRVVAINDKAEYTPRIAMTENERADLVFGVKVALADSVGYLKPGLPLTVTIDR
jgi:HlyD family secretion protein